MDATRRTMIAVIGDGGVDADSAAGRAAFDVGRALVERGCRVVTGGRGGVMARAMAGARSAAAYAPGDTIAVLPGHDAAEADAHADVVIPTGLGHGRNMIVAHASGVIAIGGGAGTLSEMCFAWLHDRPIVALTTAGGWAARLAGQRLDNHASAERGPIIAADAPVRAVELIVEAVG
jgi:uncharacterized protein (TIGR00725 family)